MISNSRKDFKTATRGSGILCDIIGIKAMIYKVLSIFQAELKSPVTAPDATDEAIAILFVSETESPIYFASSSSSGGGSSRDGISASILFVLSLFPYSSVIFGSSSISILVSFGISSCSKFKTRV